MLIVFIIILPAKWPLYPKCVATISGLFELEMVEKDSVPAKVATLSEWPLYPWPLYPKSTLIDINYMLNIKVNENMNYVDMCV